MAGFIQRLFGIKAAPVDPAVEAEKKRNEFIEDANFYFDLPWDGRNRLRAASSDVLHDIGEIQDTARRDEGGEGRYTARGRYYSVPMRAYWGCRIKYTDLVMKKLGYEKAEIEARKKEIRGKHWEHFPPSQRP